MCLEVYGIQIYDGRWMRPWKGGIVMYPRFPWRLRVTGGTAPLDPTALRTEKHGFLEHIVNRFQRQVLIRSFHDKVTDSLRIFTISITRSCRLMFSPALRKCLELSGIDQDITLTNCNLNVYHALAQLQSSRSHLCR